MTSKELIIQALFKRNPNKWLTGAEISGLIYQQTFTYKPTPIELRAIIQNLRAMGNPIIAGTNGYMLTTSAKQVAEYCSTRRTEIEKELRVLGAMELANTDKLDKLGKVL